MTILTEMSLPEALRFDGYQALLFHDILEDTTISHLPVGISATVKHYVDEITFTNFAEEREAIWSKDKEIVLFKLYDKTSNLLDATWMSDKKLRQYSDFTVKLINHVELHYGELNIVKIAKGITQPSIVIS